MGLKRAQGLYSCHKSRFYSSLQSPVQTRVTFTITCSFFEWKTIQFINAYVCPQTWIFWIARFCLAFGLNEGGEGGIKLMFTTRLSFDPLQHLYNLMFETWCSQIVVLGLMFKIWCILSLSIFMLFHIVFCIVLGNTTTHVYTAW